MRSSTPAGTTSTRTTPPSITALAVSSMFVSSGRYYPGIADSTAVNLAEKITNKGISMIPDWFSWIAVNALTSLPYGWQLSIMDMVLSPGFSTHIPMRKNFFQQQVGKAIREGAQQVVILGSGLDTLADRLATTNPGVNFFLIDGAPSDAKNSVLPLPPANIKHIFAYANADNLQALLTGQNFDPAKATVWDMEGFAMYQDPAQLKRLFTKMSEQRAAGNNTLLVSFLSRAPEGNFLSRWFRGKTNEEYKTLLNGTEVPSFLAECGYKVDGVATFTGMQTTCGNHTAVLAHKRGSYFQENCFRAIASDRAEAQDAASEFDRRINSPDSLVLKRPISAFIDNIQVTMPGRSSAITR